MTFHSRALAIAFSALLASCGGGGGGGTATTPASTGPQAVVITETNAKPVAANAMDSVRDTSATQGATAPVGVQVDASAASPGTLEAIAALARLAGSSAAAAKLPAGVLVSQTTSCPLGGTISISGSVASSAGLSAGDSISISSANCQLSEGGVTMVMNGQMTMKVASGSLAALPFHVVLDIAVSNLSVQSGGDTAVSTGDLHLDWTASTATSQTLVASGTAMTSRQTVSGVTRNTTLRNYTQTLTISGTTTSGALAATVETDSTRVGPSGGTFTVSTPTPLVWDEQTKVISSGVVKVVGANGSQLTVTFTGGGNATIQLDANGDGTFEKSITTTLTELNGLR
jgi:hypothetical protein